MGVRVLLVSLSVEFPLATYCLAAQLRAEPATSTCLVDLVELDASSLNDYQRKSAETWRFVAHVETSCPDLIAFSVYVWGHLAVRELVAITHRLYPGIPIVVGGPELASVEAADDWLRTTQVSAVIRGEGELALVEVVTRLGGGDDLAGVAGCSWRGPDGPVHGPPAAPIRQLGQLASPYLTGLVSAERFTRAGAVRGREYPRVLIETYRGCYMECSYCQWGKGTPLRFEFPPDRVKAEISWAIAQSVDCIFIVDAMFGYSIRRAREILAHVRDEKRRYGSGTRIVCYHNQDYHDAELFDLYREADVAVEADLQSTNLAALQRAGRSRWRTESLEWHTQAFAAHRVPTTGSGDLMLGLPEDSLQGFEASVDYMLRQGLRVSLYQTSILPETRMARTMDEDGTVCSPVPPRAVFRTRTFPVADMVAARLLGHGTDFFSRHPRTATLLWRTGFERPVDLCRQLGRLVWERYGLMYADRQTSDAVLADEAQLATLLPELCPEAWLLPIVRDLFALEATSSRVARPAHGAPPRQMLGGGPPLFDAPDWLALRPVLRRRAIETVPMTYRVDLALDAWAVSGVMPDAVRWRELDRHPTMALVYAPAAGTSAYRVVDRAITYPLLERMSGHFSVAQGLDSFLPHWRALDLSALRRRLSDLDRVGIIEITEAVPALGELKPLIPRPTPQLPAGTDGNPASASASSPSS